MRATSQTAFDARLVCATCAAQRQPGDDLTGLADRTIFRARLAAVLADRLDAAGVQTDGMMAVLMIDLDRFKAVNDSLGHAAGDALLRAVAGRLRNALRASDLAARLGGDEFAVLLAPPVTRDSVAAVAARIVEMVGRPYMVKGGVANVGASIGVALIDAESGLDGETLLHRADLAMYQAKNDGRQRACFFEPEMQSRIDARRRLETDLRIALSLGQFELFYQPQVKVETGFLVGFEALIRWRHPVRGLVPPDAFIPLAEELRLISDIGSWVIHTACQQAASWPGELSVAVNVAADQFEDGRLVSTVATALAASGLAGTRLELEITETALMRVGGSTLAQLLAIKALDVQVSLDDFGTGYSSLTQLRSFPFDRVKIDRSFAGDPAVVRAVAALGASLGMRTTAEGVETSEQLTRLRGDGCTEAQGYLLSRPVPAGDIDAIITRLAASVAVGQPAASVAVDHLAIGDLAVSAAAE